MTTMGGGLGSEISYFVDKDAVLTAINAIAPMRRSLNRNLRG